MSNTVRPHYRESVAAVWKCGPDNLAVFLALVGAAASFGFGWFVLRTELPPSLFMATGGGGLCQVIYVLCVAQRRHTDAMKAWAQESGYPLRSGARRYVWQRQRREILLKPAPLAIGFVGAALPSYLFLLAPLIGVEPGAFQLIMFLVVGAVFYLGGFWRQLSMRTQEEHSHRHSLWRNSQPERGDY